MQPNSLLLWLNASRLQRAILNTLVCCLVAGGASMFAQIKVISADNLTPFQPRDVDTTSDAKTVRIKLNYARALTSIAVAPGFTEFTAGPVSGCAVDGHTVNPALTACSLDVTFTPKYPGFRSAPLIATDSTGAKSSVGLEGIGLAPQTALTPGIITTVAGNGTYGNSGNGGPATEAELANPHGAAVDAAGNLYIVSGQRVRKVGADGIITAVAGNGTNSYSGDGGPATSAELNFPQGVALDAAGNLYIADLYNNRIRRVDVSGIITTIAGNGTPSYSGDGGPATAAGLDQPYKVAVDAAGNLYIADSFNHRIRKVDTGGIITTVAGNGQQAFSGDGGPATSAALDYPVAVALDEAKNLYIADNFNNRIRKVDTNGIITTVAGNGLPFASGDGGPATEAEIAHPYGVAVDAAGDIYIADTSNFRVRRVDVNGLITTVAGTGAQEDSGDGGPATSAGVRCLNIAIGPAASLYISDNIGNRIRKVDVSQSAAIFGSQNVGTASPSQQVTVTNTGNQHIEFTGLSLTGDFGQLTGTARDCTDTTFLGAGFGCALRITFAPTAVGTLTGSATVTDNSLSLPGTTQAISLTGTGVNP